MSEEFAIERGVRQGCPGSPTLFNIFINDILGEDESLGCSVPGTDTRVSGFLFGNDLAVLAPSIEDLQRRFQFLDNWARINEVEFGVSKCGVLGLHMPEGATLTTCSFQLGGKVVPVVDSYVYLGVTITSSFDLSVWVKEKYLAGLRAFHALQPLLRTPSIPIHLRVVLLRTMVESRLKYGGEILGMNQRLTQALQSVMDMCLKAVLGLKLARRRWQG